ncbi:ubiquitin-like-specific protease 1D [Drosophila rhopaloa]|uniref:Ubiquitin-like-specific protease 1D n=1 Tax=Drosophila rhopaloa TaxID=1041015 RepID=A0A6P4FCB6_DRORH|nr:ubiquitin-like-specific protease 1D [Drosophila rhopaloa]XP_016986785.1 ubiquitin-like-specific protease 1D [Drosophila rhopaloa]
MCARIMKRRRAISAAEEREEREVAASTQRPQQQQYPDRPFTRDPAVRRISLNDYMILTRQLLINRASRHNQNRRCAKMLVIQESGEQKIITMTLPSVSCTVQDILQQVGVNFNESTTIDCLENPGGNIHVVVSVGFTINAPAAEMVAQAEEMLREMTAGASNGQKTEETSSTGGKPADPQYSQTSQSQEQVEGVHKRPKLSESNSTNGKPASPKDKRYVLPATRVFRYSANASSSGKPPISPEELAEQRRLRRNRKWMLSRDFESDDEVVLLSSEDEETTDEGQTEKNATSERLKLTAQPQDKKPRQLSVDEDVTLLIYPPTGTGGLCINMKDYVCLSSGTYLNDIIIDFYLLWLKNTVIPEAQRDRIHIFSTFFHKRLTTLTRPMNTKQTAAQKRHERVQKWTRTVDIFDKDFIIVPFNHQAHWILAIICFPSLRGSVPYDGDGVGEDLGDDRAVKQPLILVFDSLTGTSRSRILAILRDYLTCEYQARKPNAQAHVFNSDNMPGHRVEVPQQENLTDCGLYLLQYVEQFFTQPIRDYRLPIKTLANWFDLLTVTKKREDIAKLIQRLMDEGNQQQQRQILPVIKFPTLNGQMVED